jgi:putative transposase
MSRPRSAPELSSVSAAQWEEARRILPIIRGLAEAPSRTRARVVAAGTVLGCGPTRVYSLLRRYLANPCLTSLLPEPPGRKQGVSQCAAEIDSLINEVIESMYLTRQRPRISDIQMELRKRCLERGLVAPSRKAITARVRARSRYEVAARREGRKAARDRFAPAVGSLKADWPLALVQIDHTLVDVMVVDTLSRTPIQRPWLTLAIDICSRCVMGFHLSLEPPSATSVALCVAHAVLPKTQWLAERGVEASWPHGLIEHLHLDNAKEFRSETLRRGCEQYGIAIDYRPVRTPHYGGHIERLIGTMMGKVHLLPGTTFSDVRTKGEWDPQKTAAMTITQKIPGFLPKLVLLDLTPELRRLPLGGRSLGPASSSAVPGPLVRFVQNRS